MKSVQNPIRKLVGWYQQAARANKPEESKSPSYETVVEQFDKDFTLLKNRDRHADTPPEPQLPYLPVALSIHNPRLLAQDTDVRPGEVEIPNVGSLHSTPEGFSLRALEPSQMLPLGMGMAMVGERSRSYEVNTNAGTISVTNTAAASYSGSAYNMGPKSTPGFTESYVIDTSSGTVRDYKKVNLGAHDDPNASGLIGK